MLIDKRRGTRVDSTHLANYLRRRLLAARPQLPGTIVVDDAEWAAIDGELSRHYLRVAHELLGVSAITGAASATSAA